MGRSVLSFITMLTSERRRFVERKRQASQSRDAAGGSRVTRADRMVFACCYRAVIISSNVHGCILVVSISISLPSCEIV